jgi:hypothetical protein
MNMQATRDLMFSRAVEMSVLVYWVLMPCGLEGTYQCFENGIAKLELGTDIKSGKVLCLPVKQWLRILQVDKNY